MSAAQAPYNLLPGMPQHVRNQMYATAGEPVATETRDHDDVRSPGRFTSAGRIPPVLPVATDGSSSLDSAPSRASASERAFTAPATAGDDTLPPGMERVAGATLWARDEDGKDLPPSVADVMQGGVNNCFLIAAIAAVVHTDARRVQDMITDHGNGTFTVHLHGMGLTEEPASRTVKAEFPIGKHAHPAGRRALWPLLIEKAYAEEKGGIAAFDNGGNPGEAVRDLTSYWPQRFSPAERSADELLGTLAAAGRGRDPVTVLAPPKSGATPEQRALLDKITGLYLWHAYTVLEVDEKTRRIKLFNPWGTDHPGGDGWIDLEAFRTFFIEVDINDRP